MEKCDVFLMVEQNIGTFVTILTGPNQTDQFDCCIGKFSSVYGNVTLMKQMPYKYTDCNKILFSLYLKLFEAKYIVKGTIIVVLKILRLVKNKPYILVICSSRSSSSSFRLVNVTTGSKFYFLVRVE